MNFMIMLSWESPNSLISITRNDMFNKNSLKKLRLFSFLVILILASCKKPDESIGESLQPTEDHFNTVQTDTTTISAVVMKRERNRIDLYANLLVGNYVDDVFGTVRATSVFQLAPSRTMPVPRTKEDISNIPIAIDSVILSLVYQPESYGKNVPMYFEVNELEEMLYIDSTYYSDYNIRKEITNLIEPGFEVNNTTPEFSSSTATDPKAYLRLRIRDVVGKKLLDEYPLDDFLEFRNYLRGLVLSSKTVDGRVLSFFAADTKLTVYYHKLPDPSVSNTSVGLFYEFEYTSSCESFSKIDHQYFASPLASLSATNELDGNVNCYAQSANGTRLRIDLSNVRWLSEIPGVSINKAELVLPYDNESKFNPIDGLLLTYHKYEDSETYQKVADSLYIGGSVNRSGGMYRLNITRHVQSILNNEISSTDVFITDFPIVGSYNSIGVRRSLLRGPLFSPDTRSQNMRLVLTYSY